MLTYGARVTLRAASGGLLAVQSGTQIVATAGSGDPDTVLTLVKPDDEASREVVNYQDEVVLRAESGNHLTGRPDGLLRARVNHVTAWQRWRFVDPADEGATGPVDLERPAGLLRKGYLAPEPDGVVNADRIFPREPFTWTVIVVSASVVIGATGDTGEGAALLPHTLIAQALTLPDALDLTHVNVFGHAAGGQLQVGVYADNGGEPGALLAQTAAAQLQAGAQQLALTSATPVPAGPLHLAVLADQLLRPGQASATPVASWRRGLSFGEALPATFSSEGRFTAPALTLSLVGAR
ncbi:MAG: hypothetical protein H6740_17715 [Alphaproteobacteria bacterium]|nr:hypothetical protein [Alphaproteobacteria bacterium]